MHNHLIVDDIKFVIVRGAFEINPNWMNMACIIKFALFYADIYHLL